MADLETNPVENHSRLRMRIHGKSGLGWRGVILGAVALATVSVAAFTLTGGGSTHAQPAAQPPPPPAAITPAWSGWLKDLPSALAMAGSQKKDLLVDFTSARDGSSRLEDQLRDPAFEAAAGQRFILVRLDVTSSQSSAAVIEETARWIDKLKLDQLPCLVALDAESRPFGAAEDESANANDLQIKLTRLSDQKTRRDAALTSAASAHGVSRALLLDEALVDVGPVAAQGYPEMVQEIVRLDSDGSAGLAAKYRGRASEQAVDLGIQHAVYPLIDAGDLQGALTQVERLDREVAASVPQHQLLEAFQAQLYSSLGQKQRALGMMDQAIAMDPSSQEADKVRSEKAKLGL